MKLMQMSIAVQNKIGKITDRSDPFSINVVWKWFSTSNEQKKNESNKMKYTKSTCNHDVFVGV